MLSMMYFVDWWIVKHQLDGLENRWSGAAVKSRQKTKKDGTTVRTMVQNHNDTKKKWHCYWFSTETFSPYNN
jgi:hypothetical protein